MTVLWSEGATSAQESEAEGIIEVLNVAYPGHPWAVRVYPGGFFIRHLEFPSNWGMNCKYKSVGHDWAVMKREIIRMAGEWLERAGLKRGRWTGDDINWLEGAPDTHQPKWAKEKITLQNLEAIGAIEGKKISTDSSISAAIRDKPMPQAINENNRT